MTQENSWYRADYLKWKGQISQAENKYTLF